MILIERGETNSHDYVAVSYSGEFGLGRFRGARRGWFSQQVPISVTSATINIWTHLASSVFLEACHSRTSATVKTRLYRTSNP